jgi:diadenosine tetraphosphatase ApaH/serine/threonine PP2A family protein phosphatase
MTMMTTHPQHLAKQLITSIISSRIPGCSPFHPDLSSVLSVIEAAQSLLDKEPSVLSLTGEHCVVGDIHGNIDILLRIFERYNYPPDRSYLFFGDYVDQGSNSCEVVILLYSLKVCFPSEIHLLRGNHEFGSMAEFYGFRRECCSRLSMGVYSSIISSFRSLPLAAVLSRNFCVHGGISPRIHTADDISDIPKDIESFGDNLASDLLWSDPRIEVQEFEKSPRGCGCLFGEDAVLKFLERIGNCDRVIRAHESCVNGYDWPFRENTVLTLFSSCDYCQMQNHAGIAIVNEHSVPICESLPPLLAEQIKNRRVTFPRWTLCGDGIVEESAVDLNDCLNAWIDV